ncbi:MAG: retropepsin-like aspartic protease [Candidatus Aminicenantaceae bacterium]
MICRKCRTNNPESSVYCVSCGQLLIRKPKAKMKTVPWYVLIAGLCVLLVGVYFIFNMIFQSPRKEMPTLAATTRGVAGQSVTSDKEELPLIIGGIVVQDLEGREISGCVSAVCGGNWIALPVWSLLGGKNLIFQSAEAEEIPVEKGIWATGDPLIILKLESDQREKTPELYPWKQYKPLVWRSLLRKESSFPVDIAPPDRRGTYLSFPLPYEIQEQGVFIQDGHIVGWAFPDQLEKGYLWAGPAGTDLSPNVRMDQFYQSVLANLREAHFDNILNMGEGIPVVLKLEAYAEGLRMDSRFSEEDVPQPLRTQSIVKHMHSLAEGLIKNGLARDVVRILDENIIIESKNLTLLKDSVLARVETEDYNISIQFLERIKKNIYDIKGQGISGLSQFHAKLYKDWLRKILDQGGYYSGMVAFEEAKRKFPDDIELHLLGVEVALAEKNWARARELLQMRDYPETMRDWVGELENNIQEVQANEGAVTIRFNPGAKHIPVKVYLNGTHSFRFILDTGATMCSIPSSAVDRLRIDIDQTTPIRLISTAGGYAETYEVKLKSVELEGFRVSNMEALIIDIPGFRDYGLLGQNVLNNFHIEIDNQKGILRLKKK